MRGDRTGVQVGGGAQVGELEVLLTHRLGLKCWRDLGQTRQDLDAMIRGVSQSAVYLLYLTSDALSYFVTIEARTAMMLGKPVVVVMENDKRKESYAGGKVEVAIANWPQDLRSYFTSEKTRFFAWGGEPFEWSKDDQDGKLKTILKRCVEIDPPVPSGSMSWAASLERLSTAKVTQSLTPGPELDIKSEVRPEAAGVEPSEAVPPPQPLTPELDTGRELIDFSAPPLGTGGFADVYFGTYRFVGTDEDTPVAFKLFRDSLSLPEPMRRRIHKEAQIGLRLDHPHLLHMHGLLKWPRRGMALVLEFAQGGSLRQMLSNTDATPELSWWLRLRWLVGISEGVAKLHSLTPFPVIHRDLKAANVLLCGKQLTTAPPKLCDLVPKVCDFGVATIIQQSAAFTTSSGRGNVGTYPWKAPELFSGKCSPASDVFALAVIDFEMMTRQVPWAGLGEEEVIDIVRERFDPSDRKVLRLLEKRGISIEDQRDDWMDLFPLDERRPDLSAAQEGCPSALLELTKKCWADEPGERPSVEQRLAALADIFAQQMEPALALESGLAQANWHDMDALLESIHADSVLLRNMSLANVVPAAVERLKANAVEQLRGSGQEEDIASQVFATNFPVLLSDYGVKFGSDLFPVVKAIKMGRYAADFEELKPGCELLSVDGHVISKATALKTVRQLVRSTKTLIKTDPPMIIMIWRKPHAESIAKLEAVQAKEIEQFGQAKIFVDDRHAAHDVLSKRDGQNLDEWAAHLALMPVPDV
eukprot:COSAG01_NODE_949_length_12505_cov_3.853539_2_plen_758_part_00